MEIGEKLVTGSVISRLLKRLYDWIPFTVEIEPLSMKKVVFEGRVYVKNEEGENIDLLDTISKSANTPLSNEEIKQITTL